MSVMSQPSSKPTVTVGVLKETAPGEQRVAVVPESVPALARGGVWVLVEPGAGAAAWFPDGAYLAFISGLNLSMAAIPSGTVTSVASPFVGTFGLSPDGTVLVYDQENSSGGGNVLMAQAWYEYFSQHQKLTQLPDVSPIAPTDGQVLIWNNTTKLWTPGTN